MDIDWAFIAKFEGGQALDGYVPDTGNSGVTIATGVDLGARDHAELKRLGLPPELTAKLTPYLEHKRGDARRFLEQSPLRITKQQAESLDRAVKRSVLQGFVRKYDRAVHAGGIRFSQLPREIQTVIVSVVWQFGTELDDSRPRRGAPRFWKFITDQDWWGAHAELMNFNDEHPTRRRKESEYLKRWLDRQLGGLRRILAGAVLALPVVAFHPEDGVSGEAASLPQDVGGVLYWQPGFNERAEQNPSRPSLSDHPHLARLTPPDCGRLLDLLTGDEEAFRWAIEAWDRFLLIPCQLYILRKTARPAVVGGIDMADPVSDILERLDVSSFRSSLGPALPDRPGPVTLRYFFGAPGANADDVLTKRKDGFDYLSRYEGKDAWFRKLSLLAAADWTGDGKAELLVSWEDDNLGGGTYNTLSLMMLGAESRSVPITAMHVEDWLLDHREDAVEMLK